MNNPFKKSDLTLEACLTEIIRLSNTALSYLDLGTKKSEECSHRWGVSGSDSIGRGHCTKCGKPEKLHNIINTLLDRLQP